MSPPKVDEATAPQLTVSTRAGHLSCRTLPRACIGFLVAVALDAIVMLGYATLLFATGANTSSYYFGVLILTAAAALVYFSISAIVTENTVELASAIAVGTTVTATVFYVRLGIGSIQSVERSHAFDTDGVSSDLMNAVALLWQSCVQLALSLFGYQAYNDFGWRIFKLFGTDLQMRMIYERVLWFSAVLKLDTLLALLSLAAGIAFFFRHLTAAELPVMLVAILLNLIWVARQYTNQSRVLA